jgi:hypothetical protein
LGGYAFLYSSGKVSILYIFVRYFIKFVWQKLSNMWTIEDLATDKINLSATFYCSFKKFTKSARGTAYPVDYGYRRILQTMEKKSYPLVFGNFFTLIKISWQSFDRVFLIPLCGTI